MNRGELQRCRRTFGPCSGWTFGLTVASGLALLVPALTAPASAQIAKKASDLVRDRLRDHVQMLSRPEAEGRGPGRAGLDAAARLIADAFSTAGMKPAGDSGYLRSFVPAPNQVSGDVLLPDGKRWGEITLRNVIGVLPGQAGSDAPCVVIGAHYDHLGEKADGTRYPGADDNASGVAILMELANYLGEHGPYRNTMVLVAFSGEEEGDLGARFYVDHPVCPLSRTMAMLNLDAVGRMEGRKLYIFGTASGAEFGEMIKGLNMVSMFDLVEPVKGAFASDQIPFYEKGIPVLHFFTGPNADYHQPTDTEDKINYDGMMDLLSFMQEATSFLGDRPGRITFVPAGAANAPAMAGAGAAGPRRVSLGTIPDFSRDSGGVLLQGVMPGSPAEKAGLKAGDIVISLGGKPIDTLADFSAALKEHQPGDSVEVVVRRGADTLRPRVQLVERK